MVNLAQSFPRQYAPEVRAPRVCQTYRSRAIGSFIHSLAAYRMADAMLKEREK